MEVHILPASPFSLIGYESKGDPVSYFEYFIWDSRSLDGNAWSWEVSPTQAASGTPSSREVWAPGAGHKQGTPFRHTIL